MDMRTSNIFIEYRQITFYDNPAKQSIPLCNNLTHDKPSKFLHYYG